MRVSGGLPNALPPSRCTLPGEAGSTLGSLKGYVNYISILFALPKLIHDHALDFLDFNRRAICAGVFVLLRFCPPHLRLAPPDHRRRVAAHCLLEKRFADLPVSLGLAGHKLYLEVSTQRVNVDAITHQDCNLVNWQAVARQGFNLFAL